MTKVVATTDPITAAIADSIGMPIWEISLIAAAVLLGGAVIAIIILWLFNR